MKLLTSILLSAVIILPSVSTAQAQQPKPKNFLFAKAQNGDSLVIGLMRDEQFCDVTAQALNTWAEMPPVTPLKFYCGVEPVRA